jgi:hypothetical protein
VLEPCVCPDGTATAFAWHDCESRAFYEPDGGHCGRHDAPGRNPDDAAGSGFFESGARDEPDGRHRSRHHAAGVHAAELSAVRCDGYDAFVESRRFYIGKYVVER